MTPAQLQAKEAYENPTATQTEEERLAEEARRRAALKAAAYANQETAAPTAYQREDQEIPTADPAAAQRAQAKAAGYASQTDPNAPKLTPEQIQSRNATLSGSRPPVAAPQRSAYDLRREQIASEREQEQQRRQEALKERLTSQGLNVGGMAEKLAAMERGNVGSEFGRRLGDVDIEELMGKERMGEAEKNRALSTRSLALQERLGLGGLELQRRGQDIGVSEAEKGRLFQGQQQAIQNALTTNLAKMNIGVQLKQLAQQAGQFQTEQEFRKYALERGIDENEAARAWQTKENAIAGARQDIQFKQQLGVQLKELAQRLTEKGMDQTFAKDMANLNAMLTNTNLRFQDTLDDQNRADDIRAKSYYAMGQSGKFLDAKGQPLEGDALDIALKGLQTNDPIAYNSYMAGKSGLSVTDLQAKNDLIKQTYQAAIVGLNPDDPRYRTQLTDLANQMSQQLGYGEVFSSSTGGTGGNNPPPLTPQDQVNDKINNNQNISYDEYNQFINGSTNTNYRDGQEIHVAWDDQGTIVHMKWNAANKEWVRTGVTTR